MAGDPLKHMRVGDPPGIDVDAWNALVDAARPHNHQPDPIERTRNSRQLFTDQQIILVRNDSGADRNEFDILGIGDPLIDHTADSFALRELLRRVAFEGVTPGAGHVRKFCVLQEPIPDGLIGRAAITGHTWVYTNGAGSENFAKAVTSQYSALDLATDGSAEILWREGTGSGKLALVRLGSVANGDAGGAAGINIALLGQVATDIRHIAYSNHNPTAFNFHDSIQLPFDVGDGNEGYIHAAPFVPLVDGTIDRIGCWFSHSTTLFASSGKFRAGIYSDSDFFPDALLADSGELTAAAGDLIEGTISVSVNKETLYWSVVRLDVSDITDVVIVTAVGDQFAAGAPGMLGLSASGLNATTSDSNLPALFRVGYYKKLGALAALPDPFPTSGVSASRYLAGCLVRYTA